MPEAYLVVVVGCLYIIALVVFVVVGIVLVWVTAIWFKKNNNIKTTNTKVIIEELSISLYNELTKRDNCTYSYV